jgi:chromosome segregation ATPase
VAQFNELLTQLPEKIELLTRRLDTEHTARVLLEARANEVDKWQKEYMRMGKKYEELTSHCESQEQYIKDLKQKTEHLENLNNTVKDFKVSEQTKREKLTDDLENLQQQYHVLDGTVQKLRNDNGELHSMVLSLRGMNEMHVEHINGLQTGLKKLEIENSDLKAHLNDLKNHNESLRTEMTQLQTENSQLVGRVGKLKDENRKLDKTVEALQQQKDSLQSDVAKLQAQNLEFNDEVAKLQKAKVNLDEKVDLLERESASFQQEKKALEINTTLECVSRFSIDSGVGESLRASVASSRKRQISITDEREEKRHRSVGFLSGDDSTFLADPDPDDLDVMLPSELPIRRGSESSTQTKVEWI